MKTYTVWAEIEEEDTETGNIVNVTQGEDEALFAEPVPIGKFGTLQEAVDFAEGLVYMKGRT